MKRWHFLLFGIVLFGFFLRIYNLPQAFYYTMDEEVMNLIQRRIVLAEHFPLIGSVSPLNTYLGPIFYYFGALILFLSNLNPLGQSYFGVLLGCINIFLLYFVASKLFKSKPIGLLAATFYSASFLMVLFDRRYWHLTPGPLLSLLILWSIYQIKLGKIKYTYLLTGALIFGWNTDYTNLVLFLFVFLVWFLFKLPIKRKEVLISIVIFILSNIPLLAFDLRHDFLNGRAFISYFTSKLSGQGHETDRITQRENLGGSRVEQGIVSGALPVVSLSRSIFTLSDLNIAEQQTYCKQYILDRNLDQGKLLPILALGILLYFGYLYYKNRKSKEAFSYKIILAFYLIFQLGILIYAFIFGGDVFEHYLATLMPYLFIILAVVMFSLWKTKLKVLVVVFMGLFVVGNTYLVLKSYNPTGFKYKLEATKYALSKVGSDDFSLDSLGTCFKYEGFYYPFLLLGRHPVKSYQDPNYSWLYDYKVAEKHPSKVVVMVSKGEFENEEFYTTYQRYQRWVTDRKQFGGIEVLILDNSQGEFN